MLGLFLFLLLNSRVKIGQVYCLYKEKNTWGERLYLIFIPFLMIIPLVVAFPRLRGFGENVRLLIPRLHFFLSFFLKWKIARAH